MALGRARGLVRSSSLAVKLNAHEVRHSVVTGASEGIGREYALQLAQKGFNVVVSARNASALATLVSEIGECFHGVMRHCN